jgi:hypothetical protein
LLHGHSEQGRRKEWPWGFRGGSEAPPSQPTFDCIVIKLHHTNQSCRKDLLQFRTSRNNDQRRDDVKILCPVKDVARRSSGARARFHVQIACRGDSNVSRLIRRNGLRVKRGKKVWMYRWHVLLMINRSSSVVPATSDNPVLAHVLERLQRLEDIVLAKPNDAVQNITSGVDSSRPVPTLHEDVVQNEIFHSMGRSDVSPQTNINQHEDNIRETEITASRPTDTIDEEASFTFVTAKVSELALDLGLETPVLTKISVNGSRVIRRICLPERTEAHVLFQSFAKSLGSWYHIYHRQTVETLLDKTYHQIAQGQIPSLSHAALLLSIFASGAYFQASAAWPECVFTNHQAANQLSSCWKQNTLDILDYVERATTPTVIEELQATIIVALMLQNIEGMSRASHESSH